MVTLTQWLSIRGQLNLGFRMKEITKYVAASLVMMIPVHFIGGVDGTAVCDQSHSDRRRRSRVFRPADAAER